MTELYIMRYTLPHLAGVIRVLINSKIYICSHLALCNTVRLLFGRIGSTKTQHFTSIHHFRVNLKCKPCI